LLLPACLRAGLKFIVEMVDTWKERMLLCDEDEQEGEADDEEEDDDEDDDDDDEDEGSDDGYAVSDIDQMELDAAEPQVKSPPPTEPGLRIPAINTAALRMSVASPTPEPKSNSCRRLRSTLPRARPTLALPLTRVSSRVRAHRSRATG
jgi:hypothetical protein